MLTPSLAIAGGLLQMILNDPAYRVFCAAPGDYRAAGRIDLTRSGVAGAPRVLRFNANDGVRNALQRSKKAVFETFYISASWWVVSGIEIRPTLADNNWFLAILGGDHNVIDGNVIDGMGQPNTYNNVGVILAGSNGDPAQYNSIQGNVIRNGNMSRGPYDYFGVLISAGSVPGEANDYNEVLDNEIYDWGDGIALGGVTSNCTEGAVQHGTTIDGNDVYVTSAKRVDCSSGAADPNGECSCAENGIDVKADPGASAQLWTRITHNRVWGMRPTETAVPCGGSGANGQAISSGNQCPGHTFVARNIVSDSTIGIEAAGPYWIVTGNLLSEIRASDGRGIYATQAILPAATASNLQIQFNTVVGSDNGYDDQSSNTDTRCNVLVDDLAKSGSGSPRGANHSTEYNFLYRAPQPNMMGNTNEFYASEPESGDHTYCYWRKRWTAPERICVPYAATTEASAHYAAAASCNESLGASFGMPSIGFVPEPGAAGLGAASLLALAGLVKAPLAFGSLRGKRATRFGRGFALRLPPRAS